MSLIFISTLIFFPILFILTSTLLLTLKPKPKLNSNKNRGFKKYPILGTLPDFLLNRNRFLEWSTEILSKLPTHTTIFYRPIGSHGVFTAEPANLEHILKTRFANYPKGPRFLFLLNDFLGSGIFNSDDHLWRVQRKTASFEFNKRTLSTFFLDLVKFEIVNRLNPVLKAGASRGMVLDLQDILERFAFDNVCKLSFNVDPVCLNRVDPAGLGFMKAFDEATELSMERFMYALPMTWMIKRFFNYGSEKRLSEAIRTVHEFADEIIRLRLDEKLENNGYKNDDLLSRFISMHDNKDGFLRDVVISVILAGKDTTSTGLSWLFWLLSLNPDVVSRIRSELRNIQIRVHKQVGDPYEYEELKDMHYLHAVITESMRLYPPVPVDTKVCLEDDVLPDGITVKKDWFIMYHTYAMGRMESIWGEDCHEFKPERWLEGQVFKSDSPFRYPVFNAGPRTCLGKEMAYIQMKSIVASIVEQFDVEVIGKEKQPEYLLSLTLRMKNGLPVILKERNVDM